MATVQRYVNTASTAGGDGTTNGTVGATRAYASLSEWEANVSGAATDDYIVDCCGATADTTPVTVSFATHITTGSVTIRGNRSDPAGFYTGAKVLSTAHYRITSTTTATPLSLGEKNTTVDGIQVDIGNISGGPFTGIDNSASTGITIRNCRVYAGAGVLSGFTGMSLSFNGTCACENNLVVGCRDKGMTISNNGQMLVKIQHNTIYMNGGTGIGLDVFTNVNPVGAPFHTVTIKGNAIANSGGVDFNNRINHVGDTVDMDDNAFEDSLGTSGEIALGAPTDAWVNPGTSATSDFRVKNQNSSLYAKVNPTVVTTDLIGFTRDGTNHDVGALEFQAPVAFQGNAFQGGAFQTASGAPVTGVALSRKENVLAEWVRALTSRDSLPAEWVRALKHSWAISAEDVKALRRVAAIAAENLKALKRKAPIPAEDVKALKRIAAIAAENLKSLKTSRAIPAEDVRALKRVTAIAAENLKSLKRAAPIPAEDVKSLRRAAPITAEDVKALKRVAAIAAENLKSLKRAEPIPAEDVRALKRAAKFVSEWTRALGSARLVDAEWHGPPPLTVRRTINVEWVLALRDGRLVNVNTLGPLWRAAKTPAEWAVALGVSRDPVLAEFATARSRYFRSPAEWSGAVVLARSMNIPAAWSAASTVAPVVCSDLLEENGAEVLLEDGSNVFLEDCVPAETQAPVFVLGGGGAPWPPRFHYPVPPAIYERVGQQRTTVRSRGRSTVERIAPRIVELPLHAAHGVSAGLIRTHAASVIDWDPFTAQAREEDALLLSMLAELSDAP